jgi:PEP-CTERM motif
MMISCIWDARPSVWDQPRRRRRFMMQRRRWRLAMLAGSLALATASSAHERIRPPLARPDQAERASASERRADAPVEGERKKNWSGLSFAAKTYVAASPILSALTPGFDEERVWGGSDDWEPAIAADPFAPYVYQMTTRYGGTQVELIFRRSTDGGASWEPGQLFASNAGDPMLEVADDGTIFAMGIVGGGFKLQMRRSTDHGISWTPLANILGHGQPNWGDRPVLAISPDGQDVYVGFNQSDSYVVSSHDGGMTWNPPVQTSNDGRYWFHSAGTVAPNGDVYFAAADYSGDYTGPVHVNVLRSTDGGASFTTTRVDTSAEAPDCAWSDGCYLGFLGPSVGLAVDVDGLVLIAYNAGDTAGQPEPMWVRASLDGVGWSARQQISDPDAGVHNGFPAVAASRATPGDFRVAWQDDRAGSQNDWNTWLRSTQDGGASWNPAELLSDLGAGAPYKGPLGYAFVYGDYFEIAVDGDDVNHIIWGEGASYTGPGGSWYTRGISVPEPSQWLLLMAGAGCLVALARRRAGRAGGGSLGAFRPDHADVAFDRDLRPVGP